MFAQINRWLNDHMISLLVIGLVVGLIVELVLKVNDGVKYGVGVVCAAVVLTFLLRLIEREWKN